MRCFQGFGDLCRDRQGFVDWDRPLRDPIRQGRPLDQLEDERFRARCFFQPVDVPDVGMVQRSEDFGFSREAGQAIRVGRERLGQIG